MAPPTRWRTEYGNRTLTSLCLAKLVEATFQSHPFSQDIKSRPRTVPATKSTPTVHKRCGPTIQEQPLAVGYRLITLRVPSPITLRSPL
ncbi:hypothetical protein EVAR_82706_1 [Eumeta japonica]|uniref:Uncharacterized protein n=1 Tax=Eumeta variegata TaxID=151549 RepID=A0A4C1YHH4_EUMVA|nr:hypothetical protein EVAR_82706_1 [Eumeta japonica]